MTATTRPRRGNRGDRLLDAEPSSSHGVACDYALAPFDRAATEMDDKWGIDRLPGLVPAEMAARYGSALAKLNAAIDADDPAEVAMRAGVCVRGLKAMDEHASANCELPKVEIWECEFDGTKYGIVRDVKDWKLAKAARPELTIVSMREVAVAIARPAFGMADKVREYISHAQITGMRTKEKLDDVLPF